MKKLLALALLIFATQTALAGPFSKFNQVLNNAASDAQAQIYLNALNHDLTSIINTGNFGVGGSLGIPGLKITATASYQSMSNDNLVMRSADYANLFFPMLQVELGLPYKIDLIARGMVIYGSTTWGLGLRRELLESRFFAMPTISVQGVFNSMSVSTPGNRFAMENVTTSVLASLPKMPLIVPFANLTWVHSNLNARSSDRYYMSANLSETGYGLGAIMDFLIFRGSFSINWIGNATSYSLGMFARF